jgi:hypothetical protein
LKNRFSLRPNSVFINLPFDSKYENIFVAYIVGLISLSLEPRSVLEISETGEGRIERLCQLIEKSGSSIHDLSYVGTERRYNMPFELGIAFAIARQRHQKGAIIVFESKKRNLLKILSDLRSFDPKSHHMNGKVALAEIYQSFISPSLHDPEAVGLPIYGQITARLGEFRYGQETIFNRRSFHLLVETSLNLSAKRRHS